MSVALGASASGEKLNPVILVPRKKPMKNYHPPENVVVHYGTAGIFNAEVTVHTFFKQSLVPHMQKKKQTRATLF